ncbi:unnamed protein product (macronuclear) [Paramecium tetraurelia]|uniref:Chromosome undetermined scaffold_1, whole genome shotgun sequence n=1 Tax=Paramecium tetraurelia TaxID=5888 RepID=Q6BG67_PARTE|nr:hypothetical protein [Paramecium tetraurelia strain d4-2]XP_001423338.1 uncharacterized protein GSPATT00000375001 [Paramecium tetraurelia]CAH03353.1 hypothetical protein PTMB.155c [Paramecium tetraurelia]CAK55940.1 unnamed protein product [Paramecium tetraurelia]|eukprot:XP_001423338.1 hypothetical protein (macronuclear) [Paramecium tetraurelia strain d4-2]
MGNFCKKEQNPNSSYRSSISYEPRKGICIKEGVNEQCMFDRHKTLLVPSVSTMIIKEELGKETGTSNPDESLIKDSHLTSCTSNLRKSSISNNTIQLLNVNFKGYLHSHRIRYPNSRLNEVICCQECGNDYDNWSVENVDENLIKLYHPLTKCYLKVQQNSNNGYINVGGSENGDVWQIEKFKDNIRIRHLDSGQYLQTNANLCNSEGLFVVSLLSIDSGKPEDTCTLWKAIEIQ